MARATHATGQHTSTERAAGAPLRRGHHLATSIAQAPAAPPLGTCDRCAHTAPLRALWRIAGSQGRQPQGGQCTTLLCAPCHAAWLADAAAHPARR